MKTLAATAAAFALAGLGAFGVAQAKENVTVAAPAAAGKHGAGSPHVSTRAGDVKHVADTKGSTEADSGTAWAKDPYATPLFRTARPLTIAR